MRALAPVVAALALALVALAPPTPALAGASPAPCLPAPDDPARVAVTGGALESLRVDFRLAASATVELVTEVGLLVVPGAGRRAERALVTLSLDRADGTRVLAHQIDDARPLAQATALDADTQDDVAPALACGAMDARRTVALEAGDYRLTALGASESGGGVLASLPAGAEVLGVERAATRVLAEPLYDCATRVRAQAQVASASYLADCRAEHATRGETLWVFGGTILRDDAHDVRWIEPGGTVRPVAGYPDAGAGPAGSWRLEIPRYGPDGPTGKGVFGILADFA